MNSNLEVIFREIFAVLGDLDPLVEVPTRSGARRHVLKLFTIALVPHFYKYVLN